MARLSTIERLLRNLARASESAVAAGDRAVTPVTPVADGAVQRARHQLARFALIELRTGTSSELVDYYDATTAGGGALAAGLITRRPSGEVGNLAVNGTIDDFALFDLLGERARSTTIRWSHQNSSPTLAHTWAACLRARIPFSPVGKNAVDLARSVDACLRLLEHRTRLTTIGGLNRDVTAARLGAVSARHRARSIRSPFGNLAINRALNRCSARNCFGERCLCRLITTFLATKSSRNSHVAGAGTGAGTTSYRASSKVSPVGGHTVNGTGVGVARDKSGELDAARSRAANERTHARSSSVATGFGARSGSSIFAIDAALGLSAALSLLQRRTLIGSEFRLN